MIKKLVIFSVLCLAILVGATYFILWPLAQQYLATVSNVIRPALENVAEPLQVLPPEGVGGIAELIAILPVLQKIGMETLAQISELAADGVTIEEAQQALDILRTQLSAEELRQLLTVFNLQQ
ncbi:MAG: hypothetical protein KGZ41_01750 [Dethiobacter sp.]|jgi:hypothetical protein|nr:hypothetical protein [Dethiobacter sp.]MBS3982503.1 hypothetical protein [Dethiobacter sp.]MCL4462930.1 hypothetical protein [Bacillota bacterium]